MTRAGLRALGDALRTGPTADAPARAASVDAPPDLRDALRRRPAAQRFWDRLAPGYRRQYVGWIVDAKRPETRLRRIRTTVERLVAGRKVVMG